MLLLSIHLKGVNTFVRIDSNVQSHPTDISLLSSAMRSLSVLVFTFTFLYLCNNLLADDDGYQRKKTHLKKDPRDYTDRDVDSLYDEWEVGSILFVCGSSLHMLIETKPI